jgi:hypothetical protein
VASESGPLDKRPPIYSPIAFSEIQTNKTMFNMKDLGAQEKDSQDRQKIGISGRLAVSPQ